MLRCLTVYSSVTGNTKTIAEAIHAIMPANSLLASVKECVPVDNFDLVCLGFWVHRGKPDIAMSKYMKTIYGKQLGLFGTLGAWPDSDHARRSMEHAVALTSTANSILGTFLCQGKVNSQLLAIQQSNPAHQRSHPMTEERRMRIMEAEKHPDVADCVNAQQCFTAILNQALTAVLHQDRLGAS